MVTWQKVSAEGIPETEEQKGVVKKINYT